MVDKANASESTLSIDSINDLGFEKSALEIQPLTFWEGVLTIIGCNIGAGILGLAYGSRTAGWPVLVLVLMVTGFFTTISMLYVAETTLRTNKPLQLSGLAETYLGQFGSWLMFAAVGVNALGCLTAYAGASGQILNGFFGLPPVVGSLLFFIPAAIVVWLGLTATGVSEKVITSGMVFMVITLVLATLLGPGITVKNLGYVNFYFAIPVLSLGIFCYLAQFLVPELTRGFATRKENIKMLPKAIVTGMLGTFLLLSIVPMAAIGLQGREALSQVVTIAWGQALGNWAYVVGNAFALCAMMTSFWALGGTFLTNIIDRMHAENERAFKQRFIAICIVVIPPFALAYSGLVGFVDALYFAGAFAGAIMSIIPILMLHKSRKFGTRKPEFQVGWLGHPVMQGLLVFLFCGAALYAILDVLKILPHGW